MSDTDDEFTRLMVFGMKEGRQKIGVDAMFNGVTRKVFSSPLKTNQEMQEVGFRPDVEGIFDVLDEDFTAMGIEDRLEGTIAGVDVRVIQIIIDPPTGIWMVGIMNAR